MSGYGQPPGQPYYQQQQPTHGAPAYAQQPAYQHASPGRVQAGGPPPGADPTLWSWFVAVDQDRSGQISADELRQALTNSNWSYFNPETCRLMINIFDRDHSGTINFQEFCGLWQYLQQWRATFDSFDTDRSGNIDQRELQTAFQRLGYSLSPNFTRLVLSRFDTQGHRALKLDDFIQCCVLLHMLTDSFRARDTQKRGVIQINYEDFMTMTILGKP